MINQLTPVEFMAFCSTPSDKATHYDVSAYYQVSYSTHRTAEITGMFRQDLLVKSHKIAEITGILWQDLLDKRAEIIGMFWQQLE